MGYRFDNAQPANHVAAIMVGAPSLWGSGDRSKQVLWCERPASWHRLALGY